MEKRPKPPEPEVAEAPLIAMRKRRRRTASDTTAADITAAEQIDAEISEGGPVNAGPEPTEGVVAAHPGEETLVGEDVRRRDTVSEPRRTRSTRKFPKTVR